METGDLDKVKSIYIELQGYLLASPEYKDYDSRGGSTNDANLWNKFNNTLNRLNKLTDNGYSDFQLIPSKGNFPSVGVDFYRTNLSGLIFRLYADYFPHDPPFITKSESGKIVLNQSITQTQSVSINLFKEHIEEKISSYEEGSKEKSFLEKLKSYVTTTNNMADIIKTTIGLANKFGLTLDDITRIFS